MPNGDGDKVKVTMPDGQVWSIPKDKLAAAQARGAKPFQAPTAQQKQPSTYERLTSPIDPGLKDFSEKHPVASIPLRALSSAGAAVISTPESIYQMARHPIDTAKSLGESAAAWMKPETWKGAPSVLPEAIGTGIGSVAAGEAVGKVAPKIGEVAGKASKTASRELVGVGKGDISKAIEDSHAKVDAAQVAYEKELADARAAHAEKVSQINKENLEATDKHTAAMSKAKQEHQAKVTEIEQKNQEILKAHSEKVDQITDKVAKKVADVQEKRVDASAKQTAAETRQAAISTKRGPVYQRLKKMADTASENVQLVDKKIRALENAKWNEFKKGVGDAPIDWEPVQKSVLDAEQNILQGSPESIKIFQNILKEGEGPLSQASVFRGGGRLPGADLKDVMRSMDPKAQAKFLQNLQAQGVEAPADESGVATQGAKTDLDTARGFSTELGQKIYGRELPGDVRRALKSVQDSIEGEVTRTVAKSGGKAAVDTYRKLKSDWRNYMEAFYDKDSPVRKLKEGKDPNDKLNPVVGDEGERAIALLGKYRSLGADVGSLGKMRSLFKAIKELPASVSKTSVGRADKPSLPESPELKAGPQSAEIPAAPRLKEAPRLVEPERPTDRPLTPEDARRAKLEKGAAGYAHPPSRWELMFPPLLGYKMMLKKALQNPKVQDWLAKDAPSQGAPLP